MAMLGSINGVLMEGLDGDNTWRLKDYVARGGYDSKTGVGGAHENPLRDNSRGHDKYQFPIFFNCFHLYLSSLIIPINSTRSSARLTKYLFPL